VNADSDTTTIDDLDPRGLLLQPDGKLVVGGEKEGTPDVFIVARFTANGALDPTFDGDRQSHDRLWQLLQRGPGHCAAGKR
jgi:hypothetical protein